MPKLEINGASIHYEDVGEGPETIVFAHGLLWSGQMFEEQVRILKNRFRCITFDFRGQGESEVTPTGYDLDTLSQDAASLIESLDAAPCHFLGLSMGGFVGLRLAIRRPDLLKSLMLLETSAESEPNESKKRYRRLNFVARWIGLRLVAGRIMPIMFGTRFLADPNRSQQRATWRERLIANHRLGITRAVKGVIDREGVSGELSEIHVPTLVIVGDQDVATPLKRSEHIVAGIPNSRLVIIPGAGHTSTVEEPEAVTAALETFLSESS